MRIRHLRAAGTLCLPTPDTQRCSIPEIARMDSFLSWRFLIECLDQAQEFLTVAFEFFGAEAVNAAQGFVSRQSNNALSPGPSPRGRGERFRQPGAKGVRFVPRDPDNRMVRQIECSANPIRFTDVILFEPLPGFLGPA